MMDMQCSRLLIDRRINGKTPDGHPCHMLLPIQFNEVGIKVEIIQCSFLSKGTGYSMIRITDMDGTHSDKIDITPSYSMFGECEIMKISNQQYMAMVTNNNCMLASILSESGCFLTSAIPVSNDDIEWTIVGPNSTYIHNLITRMKTEGYGVRTLSTSQMNLDSVLTEKQEHCLRIAYEKGYYKVPKSITLEELCQLIDCSKSTLSVLMRNAESRIITNYLSFNKDMIKERKK
jgi:predicted DNA binding protein